jgi:hypothetical protein
VVAHGSELRAVPDEDPALSGPAGATQRASSGETCRGRAHSTARALPASRPARYADSLWSSRCSSWAQASRRTEEPVMPANAGRRACPAAPRSRATTCGRAVKNAVVETYWQIGREIVARQPEQGWGARVIERLSADLQTARFDMSGLSIPNLRYAAAVATRWPTEIVQCGVAQLPWSLVATLLDRYSDGDTSEVLCQTRRRRRMDALRPADDDRQPTARANATRAHYLRPHCPRGGPRSGPAHRQGPVHPRLPRRRSGPGAATCPRP